MWYITYGIIIITNSLNIGGIMTKKRKFYSLVILFVFAFGVGYITTYANPSFTDSYEKEIISVYSFDGGEIPMEVQYSEYNPKLDGTYEGTLSLIGGEMKDNFMLYMTYKGNLCKRR